MSGTARVIELLNEALEYELSAIAQHLVHAEMLHINGNARHGLYMTKQAIEEMLHARSLIGRILVLKGLPRVDAVPAPTIGGSYVEQLEYDLAADRNAVNQYCAAAAICGRAGDTVSQGLLEKMATKKEENADYLEAELSAHAEAGLESGAAQGIHSVPGWLKSGPAIPRGSNGVRRELQAAPRKRTV